MDDSSHTMNTMTWLDGFAYQHPRRVLADEPVRACARNAGRRVRSSVGDSSLAPEELADKCLQPTATGYEMRCTRPKRST
jgi:hypothetical protein